MGLQSTLLELKLSDNLFGDALNPVFSTTEFHGLTQLRALDLSGNQIRALEEGILKGCKNLKVSSNTYIIILYLSTKMNFVNAYLPEKLKLIYLLIIYTR